MKFLPLAGNCDDCVHVVELLEKSGLTEAAIKNRTYGDRAVREHIFDYGISYVILPQKMFISPSR